MLRDFTVHVDYKNKLLEDVDSKSYPLNVYCQELRTKLMHTIMDVENVFYGYQGNRAKEDWDCESAESFQRIRHKLLDTANAIDRIPNNLCYKGTNINTMKTSDFIANMIGSMTSDGQ